MDKIFLIHASQCHKIMGNAKTTNSENLGLSQTCITFLKEWYANDNEQIYSKEINKGIEKEDDCIDFAAKVLGYGVAEKNKVSVSDEFMAGTCDIDLSDVVIDTKCPYNRKTFLDKLSGIDPDYELQGRVYMRLYNKDKFILFYGLMDTPETDYSSEVIYEDEAEEFRWIAYEINRDVTIEDKIINKVIKCREWLDKYDKMVKSKLGRIKSTTLANAVKG